MAAINVMGNEIVNVKSHADNNIQLVINLGEIDSEIVGEIYEMKKRGAFRLVMANLDDWPTAVLEAGKVILDE